MLQQQHNWVWCGVCDSQKMESSFSDRFYVTPPLTNGGHYENGHSGLSEEMEKVAADRQMCYGKAAGLDSQSEKIADSILFQISEKAGTVIFSDPGLTFA